MSGSRGNRRRLRVLLAAAAMLGAAAAPADAAAPVTVYTVTAARSASVDVTFSGVVNLGTLRSTVSGGGTYAGYYVQPLGAAGDTGVGEVWPADFQHADFKPFRVPLGRQRAVGVMWSKTGEWRLSAGRYRLHVLGDAPTTVRFALRGAGRSRTLRAAGRSAFVGTVRDVTPAVPSPAVATAELPVRVASKDTLVVVAVYFTYRGAYPVYAGTSNSCVGPDVAPARCHAGPEVEGNPDFENRYFHEEYRWGVPVPTLSGAGAVTTYYVDGMAPPGNRRASYLVSVSAVLDKMAVAAFSLSF